MHLYICLKIIDLILIFGEINIKLSFEKIIDPMLLDDSTSNSKL